MAGANLHLTLFQEGANTLTLSKGEDEATESLGYSRFIWSQLPDFLKIPIGKDQSSLLTLPTMQSKIRALPSTEDAGVGFGGASRVVMDEFEYHKYARENFSEIYPAVERRGQLVILSTADKLKLNTKFKELYRAAKAGDNNFFPIFFPYNVLPERTEEWYNNLDLASWEKECRFPRNEEEALETLRTRRFFDTNAIDAMNTNLQGFAPLKHELSDKYKTIKIYRLPQVGRKYCGFTDPSEGKDDPHASVFIDAITGEQVAESHGKVTADQCALIHDALVKLYNNALNSWESGPGGAGGIVTNKLAELETPNRCPSLNVSKRPFVLDTKSGKKGWWTSKSLWDVVIWELEEAVRLHQIIPHSKECLDEFNQFIVPEGEDPQKPRGGHDDYIDAWARVVLLKKYIPMGEFKVYSRDY